MLGAASLPAVGAIYWTHSALEDQFMPDKTAIRPGFVLQNDSGTYDAVVPSGHEGRYRSADDALRSIFDELDAGEVYTGPGQYRLDSPLSVPEGFRVSNSPNGRFINDLDDELAPCLTFEKDTGSDYLKVDCGEKNGVLVGEKQTGVDIDIGYADVHRVGTRDRSQAAIEIRGSGVKILHASTFRGSKGIFLNGAYDVHLLSGVVTNAGIGLRVVGAEHCFFDQLDLDSCRHYSIRIDDASGLTVTGFIWNSDSFDAWPYRSVEVGANRACDNVYTHVQQLSNSGTALYLGEVVASRFHHLINEKDKEAKSYGRGIVTTERTDESCLIDGYVDPSISDPITHRGGTLNVSGAGEDHGRYSAGGDGSSTVFRIPHEIPVAPGKVDVTPRSRSAAGNFFVKSVTDSVIEIEYVSPPPSGQNNLRWEYWLEA